MSDSTGRRSPTLSECTDATESTIPFWPPQEKLSPSTETPQYSQAVLDTLEHKFVSPKTANANFDKWVKDSGDVEAVYMAQWDSSPLAKTKPREWVEMMGVSLRTRTTWPSVTQFEFVHASSPEFTLLVGFPEHAKVSLNVDDKLQIVDSGDIYGFGDRHYAKRLVVAPGLTHDPKERKFCRRWKIMAADLYTPEYLLGRPDLQELP